MNSIEKFNGLHHRKVYVFEILDVLEQAKQEGQSHIVNRLDNILSHYETGSKFNIVVDPLAEWIEPGPSGLNAPRHEGLAKEALTECGRLRPGYIYVKGGTIKKIEKRKKKTSGTTKKSVTDRNAKKSGTPGKSKNKHSDKIARYDGQLATLNNDIQGIEEKISAKTDDIKKNRSTDSHNLFKEKNALLDKKKNKEKEREVVTNLIVALKNGGSVYRLKDKKGGFHDNIADFRNVDTKDIEWEDRTILKDEMPAYIPLLDQEQLRRRGFVFDSIRIDNDSYLTAIGSHSENESRFVLLTLDQLVLTSDYYLTMQKALYREAAEKLNERAKKRWDDLPDGAKKRFYEQKAQEALYNSLPAKIKKNISLDQWKKLDWKEKEKTYKFYKRNGPKRIKSKLGEKTMWLSMHRMYERFIDPTAEQPNKRTANQKVFDHWREFREMLDFKLIDIRVQRSDYADSRKKGLETSFGDTKLNNALLKKMGIRVKRQNGDNILPHEIQQIEGAWKKVNETFGGITGISRDFGLKISHTGKVLVYARKATGVYAPFYKAIAVSSKYGNIDFNNTLAHETAHFLDHQIGSLSGKRYESDNYESTAGSVAREFRKNMNRKSNSDYTNSTKECFARAMEQYFAMKNFGDDVYIFYFEMEGSIKAQRYVDAHNHVPKDRFKSIVVPLIKKFISEIPDNIGGKKGLGHPGHGPNQTAEIQFETGLSGANQKALIKMALNGCGRLRPGYIFKKGGEILKVEKKGLLHQKKDVKGLSDSEIKKLGKEYSEKIFWEDHINRYAAKVLKEKKKREAKLKKKIPKENRSGQKKGLSSPTILDSGNLPVVPSGPTGDGDTPVQVLEMPVTSPEVVKARPEATPKKVPGQKSKYKTAYDLENETGSDNPIYQISGDLRKFLGNIEIKPIQSLAITVDSGEGGGKTHMMYDWADKFATAGYRPIIWSLEEHKSSNVSKDKSRKYFANGNKHVIVIESENENETKEATYHRFCNSIEDFDIIIIDSWGKLSELKKNLDFDANLRKKYNGKLFIVIFQRTKDGKMRGGSASGFDGDIIIKGETDRNDYKNNFFYNHKNRYNDHSPIGELKWSGFLRGLTGTSENTPEEREELPKGDVIELI